MLRNLRQLVAIFVIVVSGATGYGATFGTAVPIRGTVSDIALDETRGKLYIANFSAGRIEVMNTSDRTVGNPLFVPYPPSAVAMSPDNRFLVVGEYEQFGTVSATGGITVFDLVAGQRQDVVMGNPVLAVAFGAGSQALVVTTGEALLLDPFTTRTTTLPPPTALPGKNLPVPFNTFPPNIVQTSTGISGDHQIIIIAAESGKNTTILQYHVGDTQISIAGFTSSPPLGPVAVSVNQDGSAFVAGWLLNNSQVGISSQFPYPLGDFRRGGHAWDVSRNVIYADIPVSSTEAPVLHVVDTDNLTVRERIQLPQMMAGRSLFSSDRNTLYAASDGGVMVLPIGSLSAAPQISAVEEDVLFQADACNKSVISQFLDVTALPGAANADFKLSLPSGVNGIRLSQTSGTTPARVEIDVDPTVFQNSKGTTTVMLSIQSSRGINIPLPVRLLINTRDVNQRGQIVNVPGKIVDILADPVRNRLYLVRQDKNQVLVLDSSTFAPAAPPLRTGNTPMGMAITNDHRYLMVGNDNSQYVNVFDLETLQPSAPIPFPGVYPHLIAVGNGSIFATARPVTPPPAPLGPAPLFKIDFPTRTANPPPTLGIYTNGTPALDTAALVATASGNYILLAVTDGTVAMWDANSNQWGNSRQDLKSLGGAYGSFNDNLFIADNNLLDISLFPVAQLESGTGSSSGVGVAGGYGLRTTTSSISGPGTVERLDTNTFQTFRSTPTIEAPLLASTLLTPTIGQIGETILPFLRTLAVPQDQSSIVLLTQSGLTVLTPNFDAPSPMPSVSSVVNSADGGAVAPGGLIQINGSGLAPLPAVAGGLPLPFSLGGICATVSNITIPLFYVTPSSIMAELPFTVLGNSPLIVRSPGGISSPFTVNVQPFAPAIFHTGSAGDQSGLATVVRDDNNQLVDFTNPLHPNEMISIYLTGLGQVSPGAPLGDGAPMNPLSQASTYPAVTLGSTNLFVTFAGLVPGEVGVYQIDATVPGGVPGGTQVPLVITQGAASTGLYVRVVNP